MANNQQLTSRLSQLVDLEKSNDYSTVIDRLNDHFDSDVNNILEKWTSYQTLTNDEKTYLKSYSNIYLSIVKHCLFHSNTQPEIQTLIDRLFERLFQRPQIETLGTTVDFIRKQQSNSTRRINENDPIFLDLMKMIDARSLTYRLIKDINGANVALDDALNSCLHDSHSTSYLDAVRKTDPSMPITYQHQFFLGCCTFGVALFGGNREKLKDKPGYDNYVCLLVKYVRIMLKRTDFVDNSSIHYCLRGIFALLTNSIPHRYWLDIMNNGLADDSDKNAQVKNPFNLDLFSLIINKLLASKALQKKTEAPTLNDETLLLDSTMVFLVKWTDTERNVGDNEEENPTTDRSSSKNQLLRYIQSDESFQNTNQILIPYIHAKYDRLRLMALSILSILMNYEDFEKLQSTNPNMSKDLLKLLFSFVDQAAKQRDQIYKGISLDTLLHYLYRFLVQDFIKRESLPYLPTIIKYARLLHECALKILRRITMDLKLQKELGENQDLKQFLDVDAEELYPKNSIMARIIGDIRRNLMPIPAALPKAAEQSADSTQRQVFISYSRKEKEMRNIVHKKLTETELFTKIWIDDNDMRGSAFDAAPKAISQSKVVVVLLSDDYCKSDFCQREWKYAVQEKVKVYVIVVQKDFNKNKYDWVKFLTVDEIYFKLHKEDEMIKFTKELEEHVQGKNLNSVHVTIIQSSALPKREANVPVSDRGYSQKSSIQQWTTKDVQDWCVDNHFERWSGPLNYFDGETLVKLRRDLSNDNRIELIHTQYNLDLFEITRFKTEIDKATFPSTIKRKPPTRKFQRKRLPSKTSDK